MTVPHIAHADRPSTPEETRPIVVSTAPRSAVGTAIQVVILLLLLSILAAVVLVLFSIASLVSVPNQVAGGVGGLASQANRAVSSAQQALQNATDPNHPPIGLVYDNEFSSLDAWHLGEELPGGTDYALTLQSIKRHEGADSPDTALYAVIHAQLRQPHETRILGQLVRSDHEPHDWVVYKGETFRVARALYRVNWISQDENAMAAGVLRHPDMVAQPRKFEYD